MTTGLSFYTSNQTKHRLLRTENNSIICCYASLLLFSYYLNCILVLCQIIMISDELTGQLPLIVEQKRSTISHESFLISLGIMKLLKFEMYIKFTLEDIKAVSCYGRCQPLRTFKLLYFI